jgi:hypothetical protein
MSSRLRFAVARDVFEAFPDLRRLTPVPTGDAASLDYARSLLASRRPADAIIYLAHLLARREAVWWARQCVEAIMPESVEDAALRVADAWVRGPEEERRRAALDIGAAADHDVPTTWLALAAGWSGGSTTAPDQKPRPPQPSACARAVNAAIILAATRGDPLSVMPRIQACGAAGVRFAGGGDARPVIGRARQ